MYICLKADTLFNLGWRRMRRTESLTHYGKKTKTTLSIIMSALVVHHLQIPLSMVPWDCASLRCKNLCYSLPKRYFRCDELYNHDAKITGHQMQLMNPLYLLIYNCTQLAFAPLLLLLMLNIIVLSLSVTGNAG